MLEEILDTLTTVDLETAESNLVLTLLLLNPIEYVFFFLLALYSCFNNMLQQIYHVLSKTNFVNPVFNYFLWVKVAFKHSSPL